MCHKAALTSRERRGGEFAEPGDLADKYLLLCQLHNAATWRHGDPIDPWPDWCTLADKEEWGDAWLFHVTSMDFHLFERRLADWMPRPISGQRPEELAALWLDDVEADLRAQGLLATPTGKRPMGDISGGGTSTEAQWRALAALRRLLGKISDGCEQFVAGHDKVKHEFTSAGPDDEDVLAAAEYLARLGLTADARRLGREANDLMVQATRWAMKDLTGAKRERWEGEFGKLPVIATDPAEKAKFVEAREMCLVGQATGMRAHVDALLKEVESHLGGLPAPAGGGQGEEAQKKDEGGRKLDAAEEDFRAKVIMAEEHNRTLPKSKRLTRKRLAGVFGMALKKPFRSFAGRTLHALETWADSPHGRAVMKRFRQSADGRLWNNTLRSQDWTEIGRPAVAETSNVSS